MADFRAVLQNQQNKYELTDPRLTLRPLRWRAQADGGPYRARVEATGPRESIETITRHLAHELLIYSELGDTVWRGYIHEITVWDGDQEVVLSLDSVVNSVAVAYSIVLASGGEERRTTSWAEDARSIALYGKRQALLSSSTVTAAAAELLRDAVLARKAVPEPSFTVRDSAQGTGTTFYARGYYERLDDILYSNAKGLEENAEGMRGEIVVSGHYAADTISFEAQDDILDSASGLGEFEVGDQFFVSGSTLNNGSYSVGDIKVEGQHFEVTSKEIEDEAAGAIVTLARDEDRATHIDQSFQIATDPWDVYTVALRLRRYGSPTDSVRVRIWPDDGSGDPDPAGGVPLAEGTIAGSAIYTEFEWTEITFDAPYTLQTATTYHLVIDRTGSVNFGDYYLVGLDEDLSYASGVMQVYKGGSWQQRSTNADLLFRLMGKEDTLSQIETILNDSGYFVAGSIFEGINSDTDASGIKTWQYREGDRSCLEEIEDLVELGMSDGSRLLVSADANGWVRIRARPDAGNIAPVLREDGGVDGVTPGQMIAGRWAKVGNSLIAAAMGQDEIFVEECEYDAEADKLSVQSETSPDRIVL